MRRLFGLTAMALLVSLCVPAVAPAPSAPASMFILLMRSDDSYNLSAQFQAGINLDLSNLTGVTDVTVTVGSVTHTLVDDGAGEWDLNMDLTFLDLAAMKSALNGLWTIDIVGGPSASTSTFTLTTTGLIDGDFFLTPTNLSPANGATNVPTNTTLTWADPTGTSTPYALDVGVGSTQAGGSSQEVLSVVGDIAVTATSWQPSSALTNGSYEFDVNYVDADTSPYLASALSVTSGIISWDVSPLAPSGYPAATPLILKGSETIVQFTVPEPSAAASVGAAIATLLLLARLRKRCLA